MTLVRLLPKYVSEPKVRRELAKRGGTYSVDLAGLDKAWNPDPEDPTKRVLSLAGAPFAGPFTVVYEGDSEGHVTAHVHHR